MLYIATLVFVLTSGTLCQEISLSGQVVVMEGERISFNCTREGAIDQDITIQLNGQPLVNSPIVIPTAIPNGLALTFGPVRRDHDEVKLSCRFIRPQGSTSEFSLVVLFPPSITPNITNESAIEGTSFTAPLTITGNPFPVSNNIVITRDGVSVQDGRITVNIGSGNGTSKFTIQNVVRTEGGSYTVNVITTAGSDTVVVNLNVYFPAKFAVKPEMMKNIVYTEVFTFNCTPSAANPPPSSYVFVRDGVVITEGVSGSILIVSSLKRSEDSGNYTCIVTNEAGSVTIVTYLNVFSPPTVSQQLVLSDVSPFSAAISWSPPSDNGGTDQPLKYSINITNNTVTLSFTTSDVTTLSLTNLQHSTLYTVTVVADNDLGLGPSPRAVINFTTTDSVPIIESVSVEVLSLTILSVDVVLLTDGGQNVTNYTVLITSAGYRNENVVSTAQLMSHNLTVETLKQGVYYNINVRAVNRIGPSETFQTGFTVNINMSTTSMLVTQDYSSVIIGGVIGVILVILLPVAFILFTILYWRHKTRSKVVGHTKQTKEVVYEDVDSKEVDLLQPNPSYVTVSSPLSSSGLTGQVQGPVYEECEMRDRVAIEENPAYGALAKPTEYSNL